MKENLRNRKAPEDDDGAIHRPVDPRRDFAIGNLGKVVLGPFQVDSDDDPGGHHGEPPKDVRNHSAKVVLSPLGLHKVVRLGADNRIGGLDVVERAIERPLVLGDDLEGGGVVAVPLNGIGQIFALSPEGKLVGPHRTVVHGGVDEGLGCRDVFDQKSESLRNKTDDCKRMQKALLQRVRVASPWSPSEACQAHECIGGE